MATEQRGTWSNRLTFILAAIGSAVGLGNAWRFPGLCAKYGGGAYMLVYIFAMLVMGIPLLMMEIAIGRKTRGGVPTAMRTINKKLEPIGWGGVINAFFIVTYYAVVFAWVILMLFCSFKFGKLTNDPAGASAVWSQEIKLGSGIGSMSTLLLICLVIAWGFIYFCIRNGAKSVGKVVKYTVFIPLICLLVMAIKGLTMKGAMTGMKKLFVPDFNALSNPNLWVDAFGQVFYSLSIMMAIMFAYGSFLDDKSNIAKDSIIIAFSDAGTSILASIVMFTTMYGTGLGGNITESGIGTAFIVYPTAIVSLSSSGVFNAIFAAIFYLCLCTLAIDSAFSIVEGVSTAISDRFHIDKKKMTLYVCIVAGIISIVYITGNGLDYLDTVDHWCNAFNLILVGIAESIAIGWFFKTSKVLDEVNKNTSKFKMPEWWFQASIKVLSPALLLFFLVWNIIDLFKNGGLYGGYSVANNIIFGWLITALTIGGGFIFMAIMKHKVKKGYVDEYKSWDELGAAETTETTPVATEEKAE